MIAIIDYGAGNLRSVVNAIYSLGYKAEVTGDARTLLKADALICPGVGAASDAMRNLEAQGLIDPIKSAISQDKPFFGICLGMQLLFSFSEEGQGQQCLGVLPGRVKKLPEGLKVPHMGWNQLKQKVSHPIFLGIPDRANFYFVHSYFPAPEDSSTVAGETDYQVNFSSMIIRGNLVATQFHPEKSGTWGLRMFDNFLKLAGGSQWK